MITALRSRRGIGRRRGPGGPGIGRRHRRGDPALGGRGIRQRPGGDRVHAGHRAGASGVEGPARNRCAFPGDRLPFRRNNRHRRRCRGRLRRQAAPPAALADGRRAGRAVRQGPVRPRSGSVLRAAQGGAAEPGADRLRGLGHRGAPGGVAHPGEHAGRGVRRQAREGQDRPAGRLVRRRRRRLHRKNNVLVNPLLGADYPSIGCEPCTRRVLPGQDSRAGRWAGLAKTECGINT